MLAGIQFATVLLGALPFKEDNVNETFRGQILLANEQVVSAILKDLDLRQLTNELLAATLSKIAGLPTPDAYIAAVRGSDLPLTKAPTLPDGNRIVFASRDVKVPNITFHLRGNTALPPQIVLKDLTEWSELGQLYAFDAWIANVDRHPGNLLFGKKDEIWLIDHGHCLTGPTWQAAGLDPAAEYRNRLSEWLTQWLTEDQKTQRSTEVARFIEPMSCIDVSAASSVSLVDELMPLDDLAAVQMFLSSRVASVLGEANKALGILRLL